MTGSPILVNVYFPCWRKASDKARDSYKKPPEKVAVNARGKIFSTKKSTKLAKIKKSRKRRWGLSSSSESEETENKRKNLQGGKGKGHQPTKQDQLQNRGSIKVISRFKVISKGKSSDGTFPLVW